MTFSWEPLWLSFKLALVTTLVLLLIGLPLVYLLHFRRGRGQVIGQALISLPLVLPPTVLGYYLLVLMSPENGLGRWLDDWFGWRLVFSFPGLVIGSVIYSLPFMINPILSALEGVSTVYEEVAYTLGKSRLTTFVRVLLPMVRASVVVGAVMTFAHTIGEFGVILMIGGSIPGETRVASIAIYNEVEMLQYDAADRYALVLLLFSFVVLLGVYTYQNRRTARVI
ncbi:molybdate transport system permease protein [Catalinimonas alkaloidigena]|uniref:Molybdenum transport system permease n=1 Tax=Catalinimonas alkaloidigena TaxID=1075417 RepID=A0A1G9N1G2_9BACT|nr:molybdate ABC transporter permease subunit [Catalinimonas alkaloidigena]SDL80204.1 molybdate transport system permease protein [Catalinimonas alkaloidigena]